jgi:hypothetical protein
MVSVIRLPLTLELTKPTTLIGDLAAEFPSEYDAKTQLCSNTNTRQSSSVQQGTNNIDVVTVEVAVDDVIA